MRIIFRSRPLALAIGATLLGVVAYDSAEAASSNFNPVEAQSVGRAKRIVIPAENSPAPQQTAISQPRQQVRGNQQQVSSTPNALPRGPAIANPTADAQKPVQNMVNRAVTNLPLGPAAIVPGLQ